MSEANHPASYYDASCNKRLDFTMLEESLDTDICVIGGGYTGLSSAIHLARRGYSVVLLEAKKVGWGASGRNGGQVGSGLNKEQAEVEKLFGVEKAHRLWAVAQSAKVCVKTLIDEFDIECDYKQGVAHPDHKPRYANDSQQYVDKLQQDYQYSQIEYLNQSQMAEISGSDEYFGGSLDRGAAHLHPLNYALGLAAAAKSLGVKIFEHSEVSGYHIGEPSTVLTERGCVRTNRIVLACNGYLGKLESRLVGQIMPINNFIVATEPLTDEQVQRVNPYDVAIADSRFVVNYFRLSADKRLLFGGGENYRASFPKDIAAFVRKPMVQIYPYLRDVKIEFAWGGTLAVTLNRLPHFGTLDNERVVFAQGYSGHGVALASYAGQLIADKISGECEQFDLMAGLPTGRFPGGKWLRWPGMAAGMAYYALRDRL